MVVTGNPYNQKFKGRCRRKAKKWMDMNPLPVLINRYKRKYLITRDKKVRVTLDSNLKLYDQSRKPFPNYLLKSNLPEVIVMEIKFPKNLRDYVVETFRDVPNGDLVGFQSTLLEFCLSIFRSVLILKNSLRKV